MVARVRNALLGKRLTRRRHRQTVWSAVALRVVVMARAQPARLASTPMKTTRIATPVMTANTGLPKIRPASVACAREVCSQMATCLTVSTAVKAEPGIVAFVWTVCQGRRELRTTQQHVQTAEVIHSQHMATRALPARTIRQ